MDDNIIFATPPSSPADERTRGDDRQKLIASSSFNDALQSFSMVIICNIEYKEVYFLLFKSN